MRRFPNLFCALFALFGFGACGSEPAQDLFAQKFGSGNILRGGAGGSITGSPSGGVTFVSGGASSGGVLGTGGVFAFGGSVATTGGTSSTGGASDGGGGRTAGAPGSGGRVANGGSNTASGGANCAAMRAELSSLLTQAQACTSSENAQPCTGFVSNECGCMLPVNSATSVATQAYRNHFDMIVAACAMPGCPDLVCPDATRATCTSDGSAATGHCVLASRD
jgi:hypothetical protein